MSLLVKKFTNPLLTLIRPLKVLQSYLSITLGTLLGPILGLTSHEVKRGVRHVSIRKGGS